MFSTQQESAVGVSRYRVTIAPLPPPEGAGGGGGGVVGFTHKIRVTLSPCALGLKTARKLGLNRWKHEKNWCHTFR